MKKKLLFLVVTIFSSFVCAHDVDAFLQETKEAFSGANIKKMSKATNAFNDRTREVLEKELGKDTYKKYRKVYVKEETDRWYAGTNKVKDKSLSKDQRTLANSLLKTENKLKIVVREKYGDPQNIVKKLKTAVKEIIKKHSSKAD